jgi:hypothetical protein
MTESEWLQSLSEKRREIYQEWIDNCAEAWGKAMWQQSLDERGREVLGGARDRRSQRRAAKRDAA